VRSSGVKRLRQSAVSMVMVPLRSGVTWRKPDVGAWLRRALCFRRRTHLEGEVSTDESLEFAVSMV